MNNKIHFLAIYALTSMIFVEYCSATGKMTVTGTTRSKQKCQIKTKDSEGNEKEYDIFVKNKASAKPQLLVEEGGKLHELPTLPNNSKYATNKGRLSDLHHQTYSEQNKMEILPTGDEYNLFVLSA